MNKIICVCLNIKTISEANVYEHWSVKKKRRDAQKKLVWIWLQKEKPLIRLPCHIKMTRLSLRKMDSDNLPLSMKWIRDTIAEYINPGKAPGQADNDERISWQYAQEKWPILAVRIEIEFLHEPAPEA